MIAARGTDSPQIFPRRKQAENSTMDSSGGLERREDIEGGVRPKGLDKSPFRMFPEG